MKNTLNVQRAILDDHKKIEPNKLAFLGKLIIL